MNFFIIHIGEPKEEYFRLAFEEYKKRLGSENPLFDIPVKPYRSSGGDTTDAEIAICLEKEGDALLAASESPKLQRAYKVALCIEGKKMSSESFARVISEAENSGKSSVAFFIGGSWGMSEKVKQKCDLRLSFSEMTFPHSLFRVMLAEQIYRAVSINSGRKYHK